MSDPDDLKAVLIGVDVTRRGFLNTLIRTTAFAAPVVASFSLPKTAFAAAPQQSGMYTEPPQNSGYCTEPPYTGTVEPTYPPFSTGEPFTTTEPPFTPPFTGTPGFPGSTTPAHGPFETMLFPSADTFLRKDSIHTNEGANPRLLVSVDYPARTIVAFDQSELADAMAAGAVEKVELWLTIATNHNTWGQTDDDEVKAHPIDTSFIEGNGKQALLPGSEEQRGSGPGATWVSPEDPEVMNRRAGRHTPRWTGGDPMRATADGVIHLNQMTGDVAWDVTVDAVGGVTSWLLKIHDEDCRRRRPAGHERFAGAVEYYSREGAAHDPTIGPRLVITYA